MDARALGREIRRRRSGMGLTQKALADRSGISQQHLSLLESNPEGVQLRTLERVLKGLDLSLGVLPATVDAARCRQAAWERMNRSEDALPGWGDPASDLVRVGEMAAFYARRQGRPTFDEETLAAWRAFRGRLALIPVR